MANTTKGGVQRLNLDQITLDGTAVLATGAEINGACDQSGKVGTVTLNGATGVTVENANVTANSIIVFTLKTVGGTVSPNAPNVKTITPGTGFTVAGTASDTSIYNYRIFN